jgi:HK97 family phage major capsid protein/HK97 family phage prohead protease
MKKGIDDVDPPAEGESEDDFMERCLDETDDEEACQLMWDEESDDDKSASASGIKRKVHSGKVNGTEFVLSDETPDRVGDIISADGWDLVNFNKNPIALFGHRSDFPIGKWHGVKTEGKELKGKLELAPKGTSPRIDEIRALLDAGILKAVSVGFKPIDSVPLNPKDPWAGSRFLKQELVECSLVAVPANPNALSVAKSLNVSEDTLRIVFAGKGNEDKTQRKRVTGGQAKPYALPQRRSYHMTPLTKRIADCEGRITGMRASLEKHLEGLDDTNVSDEDMTKTAELNAAIEREERTLAMLKDSEQHVAKAAAGEDNNRQLPTSTPRGGIPRPFGLPKKKELEPLEYLVRAGTIQLFAHVHRRNVDDVRKEIYGDDEPTKAVFEWAMRAASAPAMTTVTGWAAELVQQVVTDFMQMLTVKSVFPRLSSLGLSLSFGRAGRIIVPTRALTPTIAGSFVGEGQPIPVRQGQFTAAILTPKKMAVITTWTREIDEHSIPAIEGLLRQAIQEDTAVAVDSVLLDTNPATAVRPPGILNGVTPLTPTAGGGFNALVGDIKQVSGALLTATRGNVRVPAWLMNPQQVMSAGLTPAPASGVFPFDTSRGTLQGWPIIDSGTIPLGEVIAIDAADFVTVGGEAPRFEISDQATLHMEDTSPLPIVGGADPGTPANPVRSLWQTDSLALRLILPLNWTIRRPGVVAYVPGVTW